VSATFFGSNISSSPIHPRHLYKRRREKRREKSDKNVSSTKG
jgi:hypothetical protein